MKPKFRVGQEVWIKVYGNYEYRGRFGDEGGGGNCGGGSPCDSGPFNHERFAADDADADNADDAVDAPNLLMGLSEEELDKRYEKIDKYGCVRFPFNDFDRNDKNCYNELIYGKKIKKYIYSTLEKEIIYIKKLDESEQYTEQYTEDGSYKKEKYIIIKNNNIEFIFYKNLNKYVSYSLKKIIYKTSLNLNISEKKIFKTSEEKEISLLQLYINLDYNILNKLDYYYDNVSNKANNIHTANLDTDIIEVTLNENDYSCFYIFSKEKKRY
jgi:hypothetical protein